MKKKTVHFTQIKNFLQKYSIIVFLQHNNLTVNNWSQLRVELNKKSNSDILIFKNTLMKAALMDNPNSTKIRSLFQGPGFAIGCNTIMELQNILNLLKGTSNILVIGGIFEKNFLNHLDLKKLLNLQTKNSTYEEFLTIFDNKQILYNCLQNSLNLSTFQQLQINLISCLSILQDQLGQELKNSCQNK